MTKIQFTCACNKIYQLDQNLAGKKVKCPNCGTSSVVPHPTKPAFDVNDFVDVPEATPQSPPPPPVDESEGTLPPLPASNLITSEVTDDVGSTTNFDESDFQDDTEQSPAPKSMFPTFAKAVPKKLSRKNESDAGVRWPAIEGLEKVKKPFGRMVFVFFFLDTLFLFAGIGMLGGPAGAFIMGMIGLWVAWVIATIMQSILLAPIEVAQCIASIENSSRN